MTEIYFGQVCPGILPCRMIIYLDENLPKHLAEGFQILQHPEGFKTGRRMEVKWIPDEFGYGVKDDE